MSKNPDGTLWTAAQWKEHSRKMLESPPVLTGSFAEERANRIREGHELILSAPDTFTPEQMVNLAQRAAALAMSVGRNIKHKA